MSLFKLLFGTAAAFLAVIYLSREVYVNDLRIDLLEAGLVFVLIALPIASAVYVKQSDGLRWYELMSMSFCFGLVNNFAETKSIDADLPLIAIFSLFMYLLPSKVEGLFGK